jgi:hypothetical protein
MIRKVRLARIGLGSAMKIGFFLSASAGFLLGFFLGILFALFSSLFSMAMHMRSPGMGPGALVILPVGFALFCGFAGTAVSFVGALIYNLAAGAAGGVEIEADFRDESERTVAKAAPPMTAESSAAEETPGQLPILRRSFPRAKADRLRPLGLRRARKRTIWTVRDGIVSPEGRSAEDTKNNDKLI